MAVAFETERLWVRDWEPDTDTADAFEMYSDPDVMRFLGRDPKVVGSLDEQRTRLEFRIAEIAKRNDGTGFWALEGKESGEIVGTVIVKWLPDGNDVPTSDLEVGWHLKKREWGKGYATEAGKAAIQYAFDRLRVSVLYAVVNPENTRSIAVTQRLGMKPLGLTDKYYGVTCELFELQKP